MTLKAFIDESGKTELPVFVMAGFIARAEQWASFNDEWRQVLDRPPRIEAFHMTDALWSGEIDRVIALVDVIKKYALNGFAVTIPHEEYKSAFLGRVTRIIDRPYLLAYHSIMFECIGWAHALDFIFDEQGEDSDDLQSAFSLLIRKLPEEITKFFGNRPIHVSDMDYPPLQAADILAWSIRRMVFKMSQGEKPESFLQNLFNGISIRKRHWSNAQLQSLYDGGKQITSSQGRVYPHEANIIAENRDVLVSEINLNALRNAKPKEPVRLLPLQAKGMKRFLLVNKCQSSGSPHLHRRVGNKCLLQSG